MQYWRLCIIVQNQNLRQMCCYCEIVLSTVLIPFYYSCPTSRAWCRPCGSIESNNSIYRKVSVVYRFLYELICFPHINSRRSGNYSITYRPTILNKTHRAHPANHTNRNTASVQCLVLTDITCTCLLDMGHIIGQPL